MTFRDPLAAALARAEAAEAALARATAGAATPARRWVVVRPEYAQPLAVGTLVSSLASAIHWPGHSLRDRAVLLAIALPFYAAVWAVCFLRRVPVDGGGR